MQAERRARCPVCSQRSADISRGARSLCIPTQTSTSEIPTGQLVGCRVHRGDPAWLGVELGCEEGFEPGGSTGGRNSVARLGIPLERRSKGTAAPLDACRPGSTGTLCAGPGGLRLRPRSPTASATALPLCRWRNGPGWAPIQPP